jgi:TRAP-type C4-dicarboxylate transport system permease small subunit
MTMSGAIGAVRKAAEWWALAGGALLVAVVLAIAASAAGNIFFDSPIAGDFEIAEIATAIAAFSFLPHCQLTGANVCADLFTSRAGPRTSAALSLLAALVAGVFAALLLWRMSAGMLDYKNDGEITHILGFPVWAAFPPMLFSLALLLLAAAASALETGARLFAGQAASR